jgi:hypothetical protein
MAANAGASPFGAVDMAKLDEVYNVSANNLHGFPCFEITFLSFLWRLVGHPQEELSNALRLQQFVRQYQQ